MRIVLAAAAVALSSAAYAADPAGLLAGYQAEARKANAERFTNEAKVEKWFRRNCNDVLGRACTFSEKADVLAYLIQ